MKPTRFVQNFKGRRALICAPEGPSVTTLLAILPKLALVPEYLPAQLGQLVELPRVGASDIVILDGDLVLPPSWSPEDENAQAGCPVIGLVGSEAPSRLRALFQLGALSYLAKPVHGGAIYSALFLAVNEFNRTSAMQSTLDDLNARRSKRAHVLRAVVQLMRSDGLEETAAYDRLRREAMRARISVETYCETLSRIRDEAPPIPTTITTKRWQS